LEIREGFLPGNPEKNFYLEISKIITIWKSRKGLLPGYLGKDFYLEIPKKISSWKLLSGNL